MSKDLSELNDKYRKQNIVKNIYLSKGNQYSNTNSRALSDDETPVLGKGTGVYLDTINGGSKIDENGNPNVQGSGRKGNTLKNYYTKDNGYTKPDMGNEEGQVQF